MTHPQHEAARQEPFGYICRACSACCPHKYIQVNPYEVARLARHLGISTTEFLAVFTEQGGAILKRDREDVCLFLTAHGCSVYPERPLVCRLHPLGRHVAADGTEEWSRATPHPDSRGVYGAGTIGEFIVAQGAMPFLQAADDYAEWVRAAQSAIDAGEADPDMPAEDLIDIDVAIATHLNGAPEPDDIEARRRLHLDILYQTIGSTGTPK